MQTYINPGFPRHTPWGAPQQFHKIADGIAFYSTASHGGYWVDPALYAKMSPTMRRCSFTSDQWFEEDCSWCAVVLSFPAHFGPKDYEAAKKTFEAVYAKRFATAA